MLRHVSLLLLLVLSSGVVSAQRDPPLLECYLPSITLSHSEGDQLTIDLVLKKETGPTEHREHQMYLLVYLVEDEAEVLMIASTPELLDKTKSGDAKLFLDVLLDKELIAISESKVAKRNGFAGQDNRGEYADRSKAGRNIKEFLRLNTFAFTFTPTYEDLFQKVAMLKNFRKEDPPPNTFGVYKQRFKFLVYVPVNDCKYASEVRDEVRGKNDFGLDEYGMGKTPILYCRSLPYEFMFSRDSEVGTKVYVR
jgi:hypothetical protein